MKGGSGGGNTTSTVTQNTLPPYAQPYVERMFSRAEGLSQSPYIPYTAPRIADFNADQQMAFGGIRDIASAGAPPDLFNASNLANQSGSFQANYTPGQFNAGFTPGQFSTNFQASGFDPNFQASSFQGGTFGNQQAQQYMDPYIQNVLNSQTGRMTRAFNEQQADRDAAAVRGGAFGGNRAQIANEVARRGLNEQMQSVEAQGLSNAYNTAGQLFGQDRAARLQAEQMGEASRQFGAGIGLSAQQQAEQSRQFGAQLGMTAQQAAEASRQYGAGLTMAQQQALEASRQFGANYGLQGAQHQLAASQQLGGLAQQQQNMAYERMRPLMDIGQQQQGLEQQGLSMGYQDFLNQRNWPQDQLSYMSGIIRGTPMPTSSTQTTTQPQPSLAQTATGAGLAAYGASRMV